jgi:hypothetical protein
MVCLEEEEEEEKKKQKKKKKLQLWPSDWILHHDNAPAHKALSVKQFLT